MSQKVELDSKKACVNKFASPVNENVSVCRKTSSSLHKECQITNLLGCNPRDLKQDLLSNKKRMDCIEARQDKHEKDTNQMKLKLETLEKENNRIYDLVNRLLEKIEGCATKEDFWNVLVDYNIYQKTNHIPEKYRLDRE